MNKEEFISNGSEIEEELYKIFGKDDEIVIADIGACQGLSSVIYSKMFPNSYIHAFEMREDNCDEIENNFCNYNVKGEVHSGALGDKHGICAYYHSDGQPNGHTSWPYSSSLLKPKLHLKVHEWCKFDVRYCFVNRLDNLGIDHIDFCHIDVQGAEMMVFKGGGRTLAKTKAFWIEVANIELYKKQPLKQDILRHFYNKGGYKCVKDTCVNKKYGDMLFTR